MSIVDTPETYLSKIEGNVIWGNYVHVWWIDLQNNFRAQYMQCLIEFIMFKNNVLC